MNAPINLTITPVRQQIYASSEPQLVYTLIKATTLGQAAVRPPLNLCLVLDRSLSMRGERLFHLKQAMRQLLAQMEPRDTLSVVTFNDRAEVIVAAQLVKDPDDMYAAISTIDARGGTEMAQGLMTGLQELDRTKTTCVHHLILLTDGRTYGDEQSCVQLAQTAQRQSIGLTALGIGTEWNEDLLQAMTAHESSRTLYVTSPREIATVFSSELKRLHQLVSQRVDLLLQTHPETQVRSLYRVQPFLAQLTPTSSGGRSQVSLGAWAAKEEQTLLLELLLPPLTSGPQPIMRLQLGYVPLGAATALTTAVELRLPAVADIDAPISLDVQHTMERVVAYQLQAKAWQAVAKGKLAEATKRLRQAGTHLFNLGETTLAHALHDEANQLGRGEATSDERRKRIKLGTRGLIAEQDRVVAGGVLQ